MSDDDPKIDLSWQGSLERVALRAEQVDAREEWPGESLDVLRRCGAMRWAIKEEDEGIGMGAVELHQRYEELAAVCMTTGLVFTQRDAAVGFLMGAEKRLLAREILRRMAAGKVFATIGIAQLTTSRQHLPPAVRAHKTAEGWLLCGTIPWVTGAHHADWVVVGAAVEKDDAFAGQLLIALDPKLHGVKIGEAMRLAALTGTDTAAVKLDDVMIPQEHVLSGPCENALVGRAAVKTFGLTTSIMPLGVAAGALKQARSLLAQRGAACAQAVDRLQDEYTKLAREVYEVGGNSGSYPMEEVGPRICAEANGLALRTTAAALELAKGHGFLWGAEAQRRMREAMFFCVWSTPGAVLEKTLEVLADGRAKG